MSKIRTLALGAAALACSSALYADWENTHWGDSVDQVIAAVGGNTRLDKGNRDERVMDQDRLASSAGEFHGIAVRTEYFFDAKGGLSVVQVSPKKGGDCDRFVKSFSDLGKPDLEEVKPMMGMVLKKWEWNGAAKNLHTQVVIMEGVKVDFAPCHVTYTPVPAT